VLDLSDIPRTPGTDVQIFYGNVTTASTSFSTWQKPRGCSFIHILAIGGGGGGGAGGVGAGTGSTGGGGGGGSGAISSMLYFANDLPDTLYVSVGKGGAGGAPGSAGAAGVAAEVAIWPDATAYTGIVIAYGGAGGQVGTVGTGGTGGPSTSILSMNLAGLGFSSYGMAVSTNSANIGQTGGYGNLRLTTTAASGTGTAATLTFATTGVAQYAAGDTITVTGVTPTGYNGTYTVTACTNTTVTYANATTGAQTVAGQIVGPGTPMFIPALGLTLTGGGGGGVGGTSAAITGIAGTDVRFFPISTVTDTINPVIIAGGSGSVTGGTTANNGGNGFKVPNSLVFLGGAGGGGVGAGAAGNGGKGSFGCGGGGGGGAFTGATAGTGGDGGDGLVIITAW
jgi:hypothetical protein